MNIDQYIDKKRELYSVLLDFLEGENDIQFENLSQIFNNQNISEDRAELKLILHLIIQISNNHCHNTDFFDKIKQIFNYLMNNIQQTFTNSEIFDLFSKNKYIINFLIEKKYLQIDDIIVESLRNGLYSKYYLFPEIKSLSTPEIWQRVEKELLRRDPNIFQNFETNRQTGENDTYICSLIRDDLIEDFIVYINKTDIPLDSYVKKSIFETNSYLDKNCPTLAEYAAFFGSIQILNYMKSKEIELTPSMWTYAIHSNNPEIINLLEENKVEINKNSKKECLKIAMKCHHNKIVNYLIENQIVELSEDEMNEYAFHYYNFAYFPEKVDSITYFLYACKYDYITIVKYFLDIKKIDLENIKEDVFFFFLIKYFLFIMSITIF